MLREKLNQKRRRRNLIIVKMKKEKEQKLQNAFLNLQYNYPKSPKSFSAK